MTTLAFTVRRKKPVLVCPALQTPRETKCLSDIDMVFKQRYVPNIFFYQSSVQADDNHDPVAVIRRALGEVLVPYYPLAGRLMELDGGKMVVDCTGEGVLFVEADADVRLAELQAAGLRPPFPYMDQLLIDFESSSSVTSLPFLLVQVTRLLCGGFVVAFRISLNICDGIGIAQFLNAVAELARGLPSPTIPPAWSRDLLRCPRKPPPEHEAATTMQAPPPRSGCKVTRTFTFRPRDMAKIKMCLPPKLRKTTTTFEALMAALWRARTAALELPKDEEVSLLFNLNIRSVLDLPPGYYGNAALVSAALTTAGELLARSLGDAVEMVQQAKAATMTAEFVRSTTDPLMVRRWTDLGTPNAFRISDTRNLGFHRVDFGWGEPVCGGRPDTPYDISLVHAVKNDAGKNNVVAVPIVLPRAAMDRFASNVEMLLAPLPVAPTSEQVLQARL